MIKIAIDAGHGLHTPGKRTPDGEREWSFNHKVAIAIVEKLRIYKNVEILRLDDPTGTTDIPLKTRTDRANAWQADVLVSCHHNAYLGKWGGHGGVETYTLPRSSERSIQLANQVHPLVVKAMGLRDRGRKRSNLHMLRESKMPAILVEGGFMDSTTDIESLRNEEKLKAQGEAIGQGLALYFKLKAQVNSIYRYGDKNAAIGNLQKALNELGYGLVVDNQFGPALLAAVKSVQKKNGLIVDGIVGPLTQAKIEQLRLEKKYIYRVIVNGKQVGAYEEPENSLSEVKKALQNGIPTIEIKKIES